MATTSLQKLDKKKASRPFPQPRLHNHCIIRQHCCQENRKLRRGHYVLLG